MSACQGEINLESSPKKQSIKVQTWVKRVIWSTETYCMQYVIRNILAANEVAIWIHDMQEMKHSVLSPAPEI